MFETESFTDEITSPRKIVFSGNTSNTSIRFSANKRLFILAETVIHHLNDADLCMANNELYYLSFKQFKLIVSVPPLNHSILLIRGQNRIQSATQLIASDTSAENVSHLQLMPSQININT